MLLHTQINQMPLAFHLIMAAMAALLVLVLISIGGSDGLWPIIIGLGFVFALSWLFSKLFIEITPKGIIDKMMTYDEYIQDENVKERRAILYK